MSLLALSPQASISKEKLEKFVTERCIPGEKEYEEHINQFKILFNKKVPQCCANNKYIL